MAPSNLKFCRINLSKTNYNIDEFPYAKELTAIEKEQYWHRIRDIYKKYCEYKKFDSVMPLWHLQFQSQEYKVIGYFDNRQQLVAWTKLRLFDRRNIESEQFAWDYEHPELQLGLNSLKFESAYFKWLGFDYIWMGFDDHYKQKVQGYELAGKI